MRTTEAYDLGEKEGMARRQHDAGQARFLQDSFRRLLYASPEEERPALRRAHVAAFRYGTGDLGSRP